jgi:hypothetical protein
MKIEINTKPYEKILIYEGCIKKDISNIDIEYNSFLYIKNSILHKFDIIKCIEGCIVDFCIKPKEINNNLYLPIQLKSTYKYIESHCNNYNFNMLI